MSQALLLFLSIIAVTYPQLSFPPTVTALKATTELSNLPQASYCLREDKSRYSSSAHTFLRMKQEATSRQRMLWCRSLSAQSQFPLLITASMRSFPRRLHASVDWTQAKYYSTASAVAIGTSLFYFHRGPDGVYLYEFDTRVGSWTSLPVFNWVPDVSGICLEKKYATMQIATIEEKIYVFVRANLLVHISEYDTNCHHWSVILSFAIFKDPDGFDQPEHYKTIRMAAVGSSLYITGRANGSITIAAYDTFTQTWKMLPSLIAFTNNVVWIQASHYETFELLAQGNLLWLCVRDLDGEAITMFDTVNETWTNPVMVPPYSDQMGWAGIYHYRTMRVVAFDDELLITGRSILGVVLKRYQVNHVSQNQRVEYFRNDQGWTSASKYDTIQAVRIGDVLYYFGRDNDEIALASYNKNAGLWGSILHYSAFSNSDSWNSIENYSSIRMTAVGTNVYFVGRKVNELHLVKFDTLSQSFETIPVNILGCNSNCFNSTITAEVCFSCAGLYMTVVTDGVCTPACGKLETQMIACDGMQQTLLDLKLESITPTVEDISGRTALNGALLTYFPPAFDIAHPIPSHHRGYHFNGDQYIQLPPAAGTVGDPLIFPTSFTIKVWIRPQGSGMRTIYSKGNNLISLSLGGDNKLRISGGYPSMSYEHSNSLGDDVWVFVDVSFNYDNPRKVTTVTSYFDGVKHSTSYVGKFGMYDSSTSAKQIIGASPSLSDCFIGFMWRFTIVNYVITDFAFDISQQKCPSDLYYCLSPCPFRQSIYCESCKSECVNGCVRTSDCSLCEDELCEECTTFESAVCTRCIANATFAEKCHCNTGRIFNPKTRSCDLCPSNSSMLECYSCSNASSACEYRDGYS